MESICLMFRGQLFLELRPATGRCRVFAALLPASPLYLLTVLFARCQDLRARPEAMAIKIIAAAKVSAGCQTRMVFRAFLVNVSLTPRPIYRLCLRCQPALALLMRWHKIKTPRKAMDMAVSLQR